MGEGWGSYAGFCRFIFFTYNFWGTAQLEFLNIYIVSFE
jgi:hypothetical protein